MLCSVVLRVDLSFPTIRALTAALLMCVPGLLAGKSTITARWGEEFRVG